MRLRNAAGRYSRLVAFPHTVFALPFALGAFVIAVRQNLLDGRSSPGWETYLLVLCALASARTGAMAFNRIADRELDRRNPRTAVRELVTGEVSLPEALALLTASTVLFLVFAALLGRHCFVLAPFVLVVLFGYSLTKRFTKFSHFVLGLALGLAPAGAWWVLRPKVEILPLMLLCAVVFWVAGFDLLYACQDIESDRRNGLYSIPAEHGAETAMKLARLAHGVAFICLFAVGLLAGRSMGINAAPYLIALSCGGVFLFA